MENSKLSENEPKYAKVIKLHFGTGIGLIQVILEGLVDLVVGVVTYTMLTFSKNMVEIAGHSIIFIAPIPNSMTVYKTLSKAGYGSAGGWSGAIAVELVLFFVIEGALFILSKYIKDPVNYKVAFYSMTGAVIVGTVSVVGLVAYLEIAEGGMPVLAIMPIFSFLAFITVAVKRWNESQESEVLATKEQKRLERMERKTGSRPILTDSKPILKPIATDSNQAGQSSKPNDSRALQLQMLPIYQANPSESIGSMAARIGSNKTAVRNALTDLESLGVVEIVKLTKGQQVTVNGMFEQFMKDNQA